MSDYKNGVWVLPLGPPGGFIEHADGTWKAAAGQLVSLLVACWEAEANIEGFGPDGWPYYGRPTYVNFPFTIRITKV